MTPSSRGSRYGLRVPIVFALCIGALLGSTGGFLLVAPLNSPVQGVVIVVVTVAFPLAALCLSWTERGYRLGRLAWWASWVTTALIAAWTAYLFLNPPD